MHSPSRSYGVRPGRLRQRARTSQRRPRQSDDVSGEAVELTLTCNGTDQGNDTRSAKRFKELIEEKTNGRITINIFNNDQLAGGNMTSAIELLTGGATDIDIHSTSIVSSIAPEAMVCTMPWLF
ncbi:MAG: hypothetical protein V8T45_07630 [Oscillospiraceae bacterium]